MMNDLLTRAIADIAPQGGPGSILHLGAGQAAETASYLAGPAKAIVLVEPQQNLAADLQARTASEPRITLRQAAVAAKSGTAVMHLFNLAEMSSLREPALLRKLYPGLRQIDTQKVPVVTFAELVKTLPAPRPGLPDLLVIDVCGEEGTVITALAARADRHRFGAVLVQVGTSPLFEGATEAAAIVAQMEAAAFRLCGQDKSDPDRPLLWFAPDQAALAASTHASEAAAMRAELGTARARMAEMKAEIATLNNARAASQAETESLRTGLEDARAQLAEMKAGRDAALAERDGMRRILAESRAAHEARYDAQAECLASARAEVAALAVQVLGQQAELEAMHARLALRTQARIAYDAGGAGVAGDPSAGAPEAGVLMIGHDASTRDAPEAADTALLLEQSRKDHALAVARLDMVQADAAEMQQQLAAALALCREQALVVRDLSAALRTADGAAVPDAGAAGTAPALSEAVGE